MQVDYAKLNLDDSTCREMDRLLSLPRGERSELEQIWFLMDTVWDEYGCDNQHPEPEKFGAFYRHPVWLLHGLFQEHHEPSMQHRQAISDWIADAGFLSVVDYGGGFGTLARLIAAKNPECRIDVYEPYQDESVSRQLENTGRINAVRTLGRYDCLISTDVLEHVPDPLFHLAEMISAVRENGFLIIANNFRPVVKCHLPHTFHLKYSFDFIVGRMGGRKVGNLSGSHATIYKKVKSVEKALKSARKYERISRKLYPLLEGILPMARGVRRMMR
jgi:2-polyprenyl-6-hydroxyphenyl methylase/3-demethylubiquinone-9 3-methyltransferase